MPPAPQSQLLPRRRQPENEMQIAPARSPPSHLAQTPSSSLRVCVSSQLKAAAAAQKRI